MIMAGDLNCCSFIGRLGRDPETHTMKNGDMMTVFSIAVGESYMNKMGEKVKKTEWINIVAYKKLAEICSKYLVKGSQVYVSGKFNTNKYQAKDGTEKIAFQIMLDKLQMLSSNPNNLAATEPASDPAEPDNDFDDDIPF